MGSFLFIISLTTILFLNCNRENKTLSEIGDEKITLGEFEKQYLKTINNLDSARNKPIEDKRGFLNLYINFRLKVKDARERGLLNNPEMQKEIDEYKRNYSPTYLIDKEVVTREIEKLYERKKDEIRASHILINLSENPKPEDSIAAYQKADSIITRLKNGEDFGELAFLYSQDRSVAQNRGDLYYFTGGMTVEPFEDAVYNLKVGEFSKQAIRTVFGLHIVKVTDRKPRLESIRASHILIQDKRDSLSVILDSTGTYQKTLEIYNRIKDGEDFASVAQQFSEDPGSKQNGGDLGYFDRRRMAQPFDSTVFLLKVGGVSEPVRTQYGWHIIKKTDEKPFESFEKQKDALKNEYKRTKKYKDDYQNYVEKLKRDNNFKISEEGFNFLRLKFDSSKTIADYNLDSLFTADDKNKIIASLGDVQIKISDILNHLNLNRDFQRLSLNNQTIHSIISSSSETAILNKRAEEADIEDDPEYKAMLRDYENGLLVFRIDQDELWTKVKLTDNEMQSYYATNKSRYTKIDST
ncbi:MAG: peptidylprolyl isomerase, partial [Ignavibacteria bacterium]